MYIFEYFNKVWYFLSGKSNFILFILSLTIDYFYVLVSQSDLIYAYVW